jgi:DNA-directed RNA polymerase subunit RPC12/RpoP
MSDPDTLRCSHCTLWLHSSDFTPSNRGVRKRHSWCRSCVAAAQRLRRQVAPTSSAAKRAHNLKSRYGLTLSDEASMMAAQDDKCAICKEPFSRKHHIDHDHTTGRVRGILCHKCNVRLPFVEDDVFRLAALAYLGRAPL